MVEEKPIAIDIFRLPWHVASMGDHMTRQNWSREETLLALGLYVAKPPRGRKNWDKTDDAVMTIASQIGRTPDAIILKIGNLKASDPNRPGYGLANGSRLDREIMAGYLHNSDDVISECSQALERYGFCFTGECSLEYDSEEMRRAAVADAPEEVMGAERIATVSQRVNQGYFRGVLMDNFEGRCCMSGIAVPALLIASHIKPWADSSPQERTSAKNGLLLNALYDRAFDRGIMTVLPNYTIRVSSRLPRTDENERWLFSLDGEKIALPDDQSHETWPDKDLLEYHNDVVFESAA